MKIHSFIQIGLGTLCAVLFLGFANLTKDNVSKLAWLVGWIKYLMNKCKILQANKSSEGNEPLVLK